MKIAVLIKQVPDSDDVRMDEATGTMVREGVGTMINPLDLHALQEALKIRSSWGGKVTAISMGPPQAESALREALALGADGAVFLSDPLFAASDTWSTARTLAAAIEKTGPYDLILDMVGNRPFDVYVKNLSPEGRMVSVGALGMDTMEFMAKMGSYKASKEDERVFNYIAQFNTDDLSTLAQLLASGEVRPVIDRRFPLEQTADAMAMQGGKRIRGKVVITMEGE